MYGLIYCKKEMMRDAIKGAFKQNNIETTYFEDLDYLETQIQEFNADFYIVHHSVVVEDKYELLEKIDNKKLILIGISMESYRSFLEPINPVEFVKKILELVATSDSLN